MNFFPCELLKLRSIKHVMFQSVLRCVDENKFNGCQECSLTNELVTYNIVNIYESRPENLVGFGHTLNRGC